jgi:hypothetical protein
VLEAFDLGEPLEELPPLVGAQRLSVAAGFDRMPQPHTLLVVRDVLDLVGDRSGIDLSQLRQDVAERLSVDADTEHRRGDPGLKLRRQGRLQQLPLERGVTDGLRAERIEVRRQVAMGANRLDQRHRGGDAADEELVGHGLRRRGCGRLWRDRWRFDALGLRLRERLRDGRLRRSAILLQALDQPGQPRQRLDRRRIAALEERSPLLGHRLGVLEVLLEQSLGVAHVQAVNVTHAHLTFVLPPPLPAGAVSISRSGCSSGLRSPFRSARRRSRR